jgi:Holliday junction resolvase-like predicted endonuclease
MKTTESGRLAEAAVANYLQVRGFKILDRNWRTRSCEIDIVARLDDMVYFIEVKYRGNTRQGEGLAYITPRKRHQMAYAAEVWLLQSGWEGSYVLSAASISGQNKTISLIWQI